MQNKIMNFNQFSKVYESTMNLPEDETAFNYGEEISEEEAAAAPPKDDAETAVVSSDGSIEVPPSEILALLKDLGKKEGDKAEEAPAEETPNESLDEQDSTNTLKPAKMGEKSERVKDIQKLLGLTVDGDFGQATKDAVMKFQKAAKVKDPDILVDGVVGNQTYGLMLRVKKGITDKSQIQAMVDKFKGATGKAVVAAVKAGKNIALDPKLYDLFEKIEIITINGTTYVVATPKSDASAKIDSLKKAKLIGADFSWLLAIPAAVGKAIIYTAVGGTIVTLEVAKAMVNTALSAGAYIGKASAAVVSNIVYGVGQISNWVVAKGAQGWAALKQDTAAALAAWKGYNEKGKAILKSSKDAAVAWAAAAAASLSKEIGAAYREATRVMLAGIAGTLGIAWEGAKSLGDLVKTGMSQMAAGGRGLANKIQTAYDDAVKRANAVGNAVNAEFQKAGAEVTNVLKSGVTAAGDALISAGGWLKGLAESLDNNGGELVLEWLEY